MKKQLIRNSVFETNSSSSHSLSVSYVSTEIYLENISNLMNEEGVIWLDCDGYDMEVDFRCSPKIEIKTAEKKLAFLASMWNSYALDVNEKYTLDDLKDFIKENTQCNEVIIYNMGNFALSLNDEEVCSLIPDDKQDLYELIFSTDKAIEITYKEY